MIIVGTEGFAAYGGGGGSSSISQTMSVLTKDSCPEGDASPSYYDGTCDITSSTSTEKEKSSIVSSTFIARSTERIVQYAKEEQKKISLAPVKNLSWILERKEQLSEEHYSAPTLSPKFESALVSVDKKITTWSSLSPAEEHLKLLKLFTKLQSFQEKFSASKPVMNFLLTIEDKIIIRLDATMIDK